MANVFVAVSPCVCVSPLGAFLAPRVTAHEGHITRGVGAKDTRMVCGRASILLCTGVIVDAGKRLRGQHAVQGKGDQTI
jgi:hypothetical protein